jgi:hypothetical protein
MAATKADLRARASEFTSTADATVDLALGDALNLINVTNWGETKAFLGQIYLACHLLKVWATLAAGSPGASGPVASLKDGDLQVTFAVGAASSSPLDDVALASTAYGQLYLDLRSQVFSDRAYAW